MDSPRRELRLDIIRWIVLALLAGTSQRDLRHGVPGIGWGLACARCAHRCRDDDRLSRIWSARSAAHSVNVTSLVPPGGEVHTFDPTPSDIARVADADMIITNGLGLDDWAADVGRDNSSDATIVALGEDLEGVSYLAGDDTKARPSTRTCGWTSATPSTTSIGSGTGWQRPILRMRAHTRQARRPTTGAFALDKASASRSTRSRRSAGRSSPSTTPFRTSPRPMGWTSSAP